MFFSTPSGMSRRHFVSHLLGASALAGASLALNHSLASAAATLRANNKRCVLMWMGGGPSTIDLWDMKPGAATGGPFRPIRTSGDIEICEHLPLTARVMDRLSIVRNMSTREADHDRGRYYMQTGYVPNPSIQHPSYGSVIAHELADYRQGLEIPPFVSVGGANEGPGFLGLSWAPFNVDSNGRIQNLTANVDAARMQRRLASLQMLESNFISENRGVAAAEHAKVLDKTLQMMTSQQLQAFNVSEEPSDMVERYGNNNFGRSCLLARRLVEANVPFVEVNLGGWDNHDNIFPTLQNERLPQLDRGMSALVEDLTQRGLWEDTVVLWMGEFGRTPRINGGAGRDHWARCWSVVTGGGGMKGGIAVGQTNEDGTQVDGPSYSSEDLMATICQAMGISLSTTFQSTSGRPMKIANGGKVIKELFS
jgi:uncharacterized protein (DUF1501 family)